MKPGSLAGWLMMVGAAALLMAQAAFGGSGSAVKSEIGGFIGWLADRQSEFYREISTVLRAAKADGSEAWSLLVVSFAYGVLHAAGPGSGKVLIGSFLATDRETALRAVVLSFASALLRTLVAIAIVAACALALGAAFVKHVGSVDRVAPGAVIEIGQQHVIADAREPARHVAQFIANARRIHQHQHHRQRPAVVGPHCVGVHRAILRGDIQLAFDHGRTVPASQAMVYNRRSQRSPRSGTRCPAHWKA